MQDRDDFRNDIPRDTLKRSGFRWAPSVGAWQAYRNPQSIIAAERIAGVS